MQHFQNELKYIASVGLRYFTAALTGFEGARQFTSVGDFVNFGDTMLASVFAAAVAMFFRGVLPALDRLSTALNPNNRSDRSVPTDERSL